ncbi:hypothetical protein [Streptomyces sp. NPDC031705]
MVRRGDGVDAQGRIPTPDVRLPLLPASRRAVDAALAELASL